MFGHATGASILSRLRPEESLLWEGSPLFLPFLLGSPRATGLGAGAVLFFLVGAALTMLERVLRVTVPLFLTAVFGAFVVGYLLGVYLDWRALRIALTDRRLVAFGTGFPLGGWELSFPLGDIMGVELWRGWADGRFGSATLVVHGLVGGSLHTGIWPGVPEAFVVEWILREHILARAGRAHLRPLGRVDAEAATEVVLHHALASGERLIWATVSSLKRTRSRLLGPPRIVYALTERRLLALGSGGRFLSWLRLDGLRPPSSTRLGGKTTLKVHPLHGVGPALDLFRPGAGVLIRPFDDPRKMGELLRLLSEAIRAVKPGPKGYPEPPPEDP